MKQGERSDAIAARFEGDLVLRVVLDGPVEAGDGFLVPTFSSQDEPEVEARLVRAFGCESGRAPMTALGSGEVARPGARGSPVLHRARRPTRLDPRRHYRVVPSTVRVHWARYLRSAPTPSRSGSQPLPFDARDVVLARFALGRLLDARVGAVVLGLSARIAREPIDGPVLRVTADGQAVTRDRRLTTGAGHHEERRRLRPCPQNDLGPVDVARRLHRRPFNDTAGQAISAIISG